MSVRPLIGIAPTFLRERNGREHFAVPRPYVECLTKAGADCLILAPSRETAARYADLLHGLVLIGGRDIHPKHFGQRVRSRRVKPSPDVRTEFDLEILRACRKRGRPVLGICLGVQTMNVAHGGTLIQDLPGHRKTRHRVDLEPGTRLRKALGARILVNSSHHQALERVGHELKISGRSPDGVIEAVEAVRPPFAIGVQWHPERMPWPGSARKLFAAFVRACRKEVRHPPVSH